MSAVPTAAKLAAFAVGALAAFGAAFGLGRAVGPIGDDGPAHPAHAEQTTTTGPADPHAGQPAEVVGS